MIDLILSHSGDDQSFVSELMNHMSTMSYYKVSQLSEVFKAGVDDVMVFLTENIKALVRASVAPAKANLVCTMGVPKITQFIEENFVLKESEKLAAFEKEEYKKHTAPVQEESKSEFKPMSCLECESDLCSKEEGDESVCDVC